MILGNQLEIMLASFNFGKRKLTILRKGGIVFGKIS